MNYLSHRQQGLGGTGSIGRIKNYLKCDAARALFPDRRAVGYPDVVTNEGFVGVFQVTLLSPFRLCIKSITKCKGT